MGLWVHILWTGKGLQIATTLVGGGLALSWLRVKDGHLEVRTERVKFVKHFSYALLWVLAVGFILELWYEAHLLGCC